jgi:hypothetical protein
VGASLGTIQWPWPHWICRVHVCSGQISYSKMSFRIWCYFCSIFLLKTGPIKNWKWCFHALSCGVSCLTDLLPTWTQANQVPNCVWDCIKERVEQERCVQPPVGRLGIDSHRATLNEHDWQSRTLTRNNLADAEWPQRLWILLKWDHLLKSFFSFLSVTTTLYVYKVRSSRSIHNLEQQPLCIYWYAVFQC